MASGQSLQKIDVHNVVGRYAKVLAEVEIDTSICVENRQHITEFLNACQLGKTVFGREKKRIGERRLLKYLYALRNINTWLGNKDFRTVSQSDMENFVARVDRNGLWKVINGVSVSQSYSDWTRRDIKVCVKKFYKWLLGDGRQFPDIVAWIDTFITEQAPPCLTLDETRTLVDAASTIKGKSLMWALFETGARIEELLNVRLSHVSDKETHLLVWIEFPKTYKRNLPIFEGSKYLRKWIEQHPERDNPNAQLFPMSYPTIAKFLKRLGERSIGKKITPHLLRHSFATWLASKKVGRYQMCKLMGWAMSSDMPDKYIDRVGVVWTCPYLIPHPVLV